MKRWDGITPNALTLALSRARERGFVALQRGDDASFLLSRLRERCPEGGEGKRSGAVGGITPNALTLALSRKRERGFAALQ